MDLDTWDPNELEEGKNHALQGAEILERVYQNTPGNSFLPMAIEIAHYHHARWDGSGYPSGIAGKEIPLSARITMIVDVYDTLRGEPDNRDSGALEDCFKFIEQGSASWFDPEIVRVFLKVKKRLRHS